MSDVGEMSSETGPDGKACDEDDGGDKDDEDVGECAALVDAKEADDEECEKDEE